jgi:hypothetical protein
VSLYEITHTLMSNLKVLSFTFHVLRSNFKSGSKVPSSWTLACVLFHINSLSYFVCFILFYILWFWGLNPGPYSMLGKALSTSTETLSYSCSSWIFETASHFVSKLASNSGSSCLSLARAGMTGPRPPC